MQIRYRDDEACDRQPELAWDTIWVQRIDASGGFGDWLLAGPSDQAESRGGLRAEAQLHTATLLILFTDARAPADARLPTPDGDRRGWWGDSVRLDGEPERALGSLVWLEVERAILNEATAARVKDRAAAALAVLIEQGAVARTDIETEVRPADGYLALRVAHYGHDGARMYDQRFALLWDQTRAPARMNYGDIGFAA